MTDTTKTTCDEKREALAAYLNKENDLQPGFEIKADELVEVVYSDDTFEHEPHTVREGTSPSKAKELIERMRQALDVSGFGHIKTSGQLEAAATDDKALAADQNKAEESRKVYRESGQNALGNCQFDLINEIKQKREVLATYENIMIAMAQRCPERLRVGIHDVANALYFVCHESADNEHASDHRATMIEAFDGVEVEDRTTPRETNEGEYMVLDDSEADANAAEYIKGSLWAFCPDFLASHTGLPVEVFQALAEKCEDANEPILKMIDDIDAFVEAAISADGRGHFISFYDGEEIESGDYYIYRTS